VDAGRSRHIEPGRSEWTRRTCQHGPLGRQRTSSS
jgi:hypothetical protein